MAFKNGFKQPTCAKSISVQVNLVVKSFIKAPYGSRAFNPPERTSSSSLPFIIAVSQKVVGDFKFKIFYGQRDRGLLILLSGTLGFDITRLSKNNFYLSSVKKYIIVYYDLIF